MSLRVEFQTTGSHKNSWAVVCNVPKGVWWTVGFLPDEPGANQYMESLKKYAPHLDKEPEKM